MKGIGINLLSGPRNISTAMMYSFAQRPRCEVIDEPFYAHYLTRTGAEHPGRTETLASMPSDSEQVIQQINTSWEKCDELFLKNMPHHMAGIKADRLSRFRHVFLIRHPSLMIRSFSKVIPSVSLADLALKEQVELFEQLNSKQEVAVIDSATVLKDPEHALKALCHQIGIPFHHQMLEWSTGAIPQDGPWAKYWYGNVHRSTGFKSRDETPVELSAEYEPLLKKALPLYLHMKQHESI